MIWGLTISKIKFLHNKNYQGESWEKIELVLFTIQVFCLTLKIVATHVTNKWKKQVASLEKLSNLPHSIHLSKKLLFCLIALTIYFAAQTELSARVPTYRTNLHACQIDQRGMEGLMLKAFYFRYSMFM